MICDVGVGVCSRSLDGNSTGENPVTETQLKETCRTLTPRRMGGGGPARARWHTSRCLSFRAVCRHPVSFKDPLGSCPSQWTTSTPLLSTRTVEEENRCAGTFSKRVRGHSGFRFGSTAEGGAGQYGSPRWNSHPHGSNEQKLQWKLQFQKKSCKNVKTSSRNFTHPSIL